MKEEEIRSKFVLIPLEMIEPNEGQLEGLPANPRDIVDRKFDLLIKDVLMFPEMIELRGMMVYPLENKRFIAIGGNMRHRALTEISKMSPAQINIMLGKCSGYAQLSSEQREHLRNTWGEWVKSKEKNVPCGIISKETTIEQIKAMAILDNSGFGRWQWDMLANEWNAEELTEWGIDLPIMESEINTDDFFDDLDDDGSKDKGEKITVTIPLEMKDQKDDIKSIIEGALSDYSGIKVK